MTRTTSVLAVVVLATLLAGCGGSSSDGATSTTTPPPSSGSPPTAPEPTPAPPLAPVAITKAEAFRFLNQATMGATEAEAVRVIAMGYEAWIDDQLARPASLELPYVQSLPVPQNVQDLHRDRL